MFDKNNKDMKHFDDPPFEKLDLSFCAQENY